MLRLDGRTRQARRLRELINWLIEETGGTASASPAQLERIHRTAQLVLLAEQSRERALRSDGDLESVVRIENLAARTLRSLRVTVPKRSSKPSLAEYLASRGVA